VLGGNGDENMQNAMATEANKEDARRCSRVVVVSTMCLVVLSPTCIAQQVDAVGVGDWLTFTANIPEAGYRETQFFDPHYNTGVLQWDSRAEFWLPPFRDKFSWGLYIRFAGIVGSRTDAFQNALVGGPGVGFQVYPFSSWRFQGPDSTVGKILGPTRFFAEYNRTDYWGAENTWRPRDQSRIGFEYWKALNVNEPGRAWWLETWNGLYWQSSNEFTDRYDSMIFANAWRSGIRKPHSRAVSTITPYVAVQSSRTKYDYGGTRPCGFGSGNCDFYWENGVWVGGGLRYAPSLATLAGRDRAWLNRFVVYGEYLRAAAYYGPAAPASVPRFDVRVGLSASFGQWYR
jgi:hypothetical protein